MVVRLRTVLISGEGGGVLQGHQVPRLAQQQGSGGKSASASRAPAAATAQLLWRPPPPPAKPMVAREASAAGPSRGQGAQRSPEERASCRECPEAPRQAGNLLLFVECFCHANPGAGLCSSAPHGGGGAILSPFFPLGFCRV